MDVAIIGAGPAGMAAAIYLHRAGLAPLVLERGERGGLLRNANLVENYPGFAGGIRGLDLVERFSKQLDLLDIKVTRAEVSAVGKSRTSFRIESDAGDFATRSLIAATGTRPKEVRLKGSRELLGSKIFDELVNMPLADIAGKRTLVVGGGDAAFDYSLNLVGRGCDVTIISRSEPKCLSLLRARAEAAGVDLIVGADPEIVKDKTPGALLQCRIGKGRVEYAADYILMACGREPNIEVLSPELRKKVENAAGIPETNVPGLFLAGDVVRGTHRQTAIAVGDGVSAAMLVEEYLRKRDGKGSR
jgi:thioredoxin reductase (NADPH)